MTRPCKQCGTPLRKLGATKLPPTRCDECRGKAHRVKLKGGRRCQRKTP
jgi:hypothetical protein